MQALPLRLAFCVLWRHTAIATTVSLCTIRNFLPSFHLLSLSPVSSKFLASIVCYHQSPQFLSFLRSVFLLWEIHPFHTYRKLCATPRFCQLVTVLCWWWMKGHYCAYWLKILPHSLFFWHSEFQHHKPMLSAPNSWQHCYLSYKSHHLISFPHTWNSSKHCTPFPSLFYGEIAFTFSLHFQPAPIPPKQGFWVVERSVPDYII